MNITTSVTSRPAISTTVITANARDTSQMLDELLVINDVEESTWLPGALKRSSRWFSESNYLGVDENHHLMYSLNRKEIYLFTAIGVTGLTLLGSLALWLVG
ncbi:hypothetical protein [Spirosoma sp.]|uniref:hypothetical protein n=1 Tax=Spirosoma sp. TaxID=1899569 RepID=UPI0026263D06|nr:hypothetical protein [Spirosoma sp.]MCX6218943.1 hypothetical protein [Spirosoma sp.]